MNQDKDALQLERLGIAPNSLNTQLKNFEEGFDFVDLIAPASIENGIQQVSETKAIELIKKYDHFRDSLDIVKFVPASGAATRMFKSLYESLDLFEKSQEINESGVEFIERLSGFPFYNDLKDVIF